MDSYGWVVTRDGVKVSPVLADENSCSVWVQKHQPMSTDWAVKHEGYGWRPATAEEVEAQGRQ